MRGCLPVNLCLETMLPSDSKWSQLTPFAALVGGHQQPCQTIARPFQEGWVSFHKPVFWMGIPTWFLCGRVWLHQSRKIDESGNTCANPSSICARYAARGTTLKTCVVPSRPRKPDKILGRNLENCPQNLFSFFSQKKIPHFGKIK